MYGIETWQFIEQRFVPCPSLGRFATEAAALEAMRVEIHASGKDMSRFLVALLSPTITYAPTDLDRHHLRR